MSDVLTVYKDFRSVICGKEVSQFFEIKNDKNVSTSLSILEDEEDYAFNVTPRAIRVNPGGIAQFKVTFISHVPNITYKKKYIISDGVCVTAHLVVCSKSIGPCIKKMNYVSKFYILRSTTAIIKRFEIENKSVCPAKFHFERPGNNHPFQISQEFGTLQAESKCIIDIKFTPTQPGTYCKRVYCLLQYNPPISFLLIGIYNTALKTNPAELNFHVPSEQAIQDNYESYMSNLKMDIPEEVDPCLNVPLSRKTVVRFDENDDESSNLEFDEEKGKHSCESIPTEESNSVILTACFLDVGNSPTYAGLQLINTSELDEFYFEWNNDNARHFSINPRNGTLKEKQRLDLMLNFAPDSPDRLYNGELDVRIFPVKKETEGQSPGVIVLPFTLNLSVIGHSFSDSSAGWLEQCEIQPKEIILPACTPGEVVHSTFIIKRHGHLPVIFQFIPPKKSCILIKPPLGYIFNPYQLFVLEFDSANKPEGTYREKWKVAYNTSSRYFGRVNITARIENPKVVVGTENKFTFDTTLPGGECTASIPVRNPTKLTLQFEFSIPRCITWIEIPDRCQTLEPSGSTHVDIIFKPKEIREYFDQICCFIKTVNAPNYTVSSVMELHGSCQEGFLVATPSSHNFGKCLYGTEHKKKFSLYNFTPIVMHYELFECNNDCLHLNSKNLIKALPDKGSLPGKSKIEVEVSIIPYCTEISTHFLQCRFLKSKTERSVLGQEHKTIFTFSIEGILPIFQVIDLNLEGGGPLISPDWLWKMMDINGLNKCLRRIFPGEEEIIEMRLPEAAVGASPISIYLLLEAKNLYDMDLEIINLFYRHFVRQSSVNEQEIEGNNLVVFEPSKLHLKPKCREVVKLTVTFEAIGNTFYEWSLLLSQNRVIKLKTVITTIPEDDSCPTSMYMYPEIILKPIFIGDLTPPVQLFWLYNNTSKTTSYIFDKTALREATPPFHKIFDCLNSNEILPPFSALPLMILFKPNELRRFEATAHLCLKIDHTVRLTLIGNGILNYSKITEFCHEQTVPEIPVLKLNRVALETSVKHLIIAPFPTFSSVHRLFFLRNTSKDKIWAFHWHSFYVKTLMKAFIEPSNGKIPPGDQILLQLKLDSFQHPTNITFSIPCDVTDYTSLEAHENAVSLKAKMIEKYKDYFTITEKGTFTEVPEVEIPKKPEKEHIFITVSTNIVSAQSLEIKLYPMDILKLQSGKEIHNVAFEKLELDLESRRCVDEILEKILWKILSSLHFKEKFKKYQDCFGKTTYLQTVPQTEKETRELRKDLLTYLPKNIAQHVLKSTIINALRKHLRE